MLQPVREYVLRVAVRQVSALAIAGLLAFTLLATQGFVATQGSATQGRDQTNIRPASATQGAPAISGPARVVDGDTIVIGDTRIRLEGIDAPESAQTCGQRWLGTWPCGQAATDHLARLVRDRQVQCDNRGHDAYGRMLGICSTEGLEINADMVRNGLAWAFIKYSTRLVDAEAGARALRIGIWQGDSTPAWVWRAQRWSRAASEATPDTPQGCIIKGNITRNGNIYHMPWSPWYTTTKVEQARGERWFCSEAEAISAGWRPALTR